MELFEKSKEELIQEILMLKSRDHNVENNLLSLQSFENKFRQAIDKIGLITLNVNKQGVITFCNQAFLQFTGWSANDVINHDWNKIIPKANHKDEDYNKELLGMFDSNSPTRKVKRKVLISDGSVRNISFHVIHNFADQYTQEVILVGEDITEKKKVFKALKESNEHLYDLFENANDLIQVTSIEGELLFVNNSWKNTMGYKDDEIIRLNFSDIIHPDHRSSTLEQVQNILEGQHDDKIETVFLTKSGSSIYTIGSINVRYEQDKPVAFRGIFHNATERIRAEKAQNLYYKIAALTINSDNLNTLLTNIHTELKSMIAVNNFHVALIDKETEMLDFPYYVDETFAHVITTNKRKISKGLTEYSLFNENPTFLYEEDILKLVEENKVELLGPVPKIWLGVPLRLENRTIGVIGVKSHSDRNKYKQRHLELLDFISGQIAIAIERKRNEEKIVEQTARLESIFQSSTHLIWTVDKNLNITNFNQNYSNAIYNKYGTYPMIDPNEGETSLQLLADKTYHDFVKNCYTEAFKGVPQHYEALTMEIDGRQVWRETYLNPIFLPNGIIEEVSGIAHDITQKKQSEIAIQESEEKFRSIFESFQDIYYRTDVYGKITMISPSGCELSGYTEEEIIGKQITAFYVNQKKQGALIRELLKTGTVRNFENNLELKSGEVIQTISNIRLIYNKQGKPISVEGVARDITYLKLYQEATLKAKEFAERSLKIKESFLANMSHEIRTPMNGIIGMIDLLNDSILDINQRKYLDTIKISSQTLLSILNDILDLSKIEAGKMHLKLTSIDFKNTIEKVFALFYQQALNKNIVLDFQISENIPKYILADEIRLIQIISNLTSNAIKFTDVGNVLINVILDNQHGSTYRIKVEIADTGIGITEDGLKKLFESFSQLDNSSSKSYAGTGLGLAISKELCKMMNGEIGVRSTKGTGSTFWFTFEARASKREATPIQNEPATKLFIHQSFSSSPYILLVDDNQVNQLVASEILKKYGCTVDIVDNGIDAIEKVKNNDYDVILMDIQMPRMNGIEATAAIRSLNKEKLPPIIAMTAYSMKEDKDKFINNGMDDYLSKPITSQTLIGKINDWLNPDDTNEYQSEDVMLDITESEDTAIENNMIDLNVYHKLKSFADADMLLQIYQEFVKETDEQLLTAQQNIDNNDYDGLKSILHTLKGSAGTLGITALASKSKYMESQLKEHNYDNLIATFDELLNDFTYFKDHFQAYLNQN